MRWAAWHSMGTGRRARYGGKQEGTVCDGQEGTVQGQAEGHGMWWAGGHSMGAGKKAQYVVGRRAQYGPTAVPTLSPSSLLYEAVTSVQTLLFTLGVHPPTVLA